MSIKKLISAICMLAVALPSGAKTLSYAYDNSGNRVAREIVVNTTKAPMKIAGQTVSELLSQKEVRVHTEIGRLSVEIPSYETGDIGSITVHSVSGMTVAHMDLCDAVTVIDMSGNPAGVYLMEINLNGCKSVWKVMVR